MDMLRNFSSTKTDDRPAFEGWAPGDYLSGGCRNCGCSYIGGKYSYHCADCAYNSVLVEAPASDFLAPEPMKLQVMWEATRTEGETYQTWLERKLIMAWEETGDTTPDPPALSFKGFPPLEEFEFTEAQLIEGKEAE